MTPPEGIVAAGARKDGLDLAVTKVVARLIGIRVDEVRKRTGGSHRRAWPAESNMSPLPRVRSVVGQSEQTFSLRSRRKFWDPAPSPSEAARVHRISGDPAPQNRMDGREAAAGSIGHAG
jgi:hypothetical protein